MALLDSHDGDKVNTVTRASHSSSWLSRLRELGPDQVYVRHSPMTPRYGKAAQKLRYLLREGVELGSRGPGTGNPGPIEIALWAPSPKGRGFPGYYFCFRIYLEGGELAAGILFCFYDGTDRSPSFKSLETAQEYARSQGFENHEDDH